MIGRGDADAVRSASNVATVEAATLAQRQNHQICTEPAVGLLQQKLELAGAGAAPDWPRLRMR